ncbi:F-box At4g00755-like [Olea europaea subsp. europaea]|uniref:F-box At4g00755-like n=1 Tax=Olea europaea subsp. europaea TaxID=158383 RepID=A0A8S0RES2_OLEEU|nr:F-box At4g00755-like [Olea europaea subsp. europaea]
MKGTSDFVELLGPDLSMKIMMCLEDPSDLVRVSAVSIMWRQFVIANGLCRQLWHRMFPEVSNIDNIFEVKNMTEGVEFEPDDSTGGAHLERDHRVFAFLTRGLTSYMRNDCISDAICASSTDHYPRESIKNTLEPSDVVDDRPSYWSSKGSIDVAFPETLIYRLAARLCVISEIHVKPFQAYFQLGFPIYSSKAVRFRVGHPKVPLDVQDVEEFSDDKYVWTYTSPEFPMAQENFLQKFKLPKPVLCIGEILKVELLGRVQTQETDELYYICITHVEVVGRLVLPAFDIKIPELGKCLLEYHPEAAHSSSPAKSSQGDSSSPSQVLASIWS